MHQDSGNYNLATDFMKNEKTLKHNAQMQTDKTTEIAKEMKRNEKKNKR